MFDTLKDIAEQPQILIENSSVVAEAYAGLRSLVGKDAEVVMTGMATSLFAWHSAGIVLRNRARPPVIVETSEYLHYSRPEHDERPLLVLSRSGESVEIRGLIDSIDRNRLVVALTEGRDNTLARRAQVVLSYAAREQAFWNTKSFLTSLALALAIAGGMAGRSDLSPERWLPRLGELIAGLLAREPDGLADAAQQIATAGVSLYVARGHLLGVAQNGAVDLQEGMRLAVISFSGGIMRHGPMELGFRRDAVAVVLIPADPAAATMARLASDMARQGARVVVLAAGDIELPTGITMLRLPASEPELSPMIFAVALQLLNVAVANALGVASIRPTSITKVTRVE
jgi:fructoselysine-6-P-deglycase FrlB-like protein